MSSETSIHIEGVCKSFPVYRKPYHRLLQMVMPGERDRWHQNFSALRNVSFDVRRGETVGIVGRNGSGKSTLLQLICGTLTPTEGIIQARGRIAALLELGAGFNPEFTGRENVYLNGSMLGLTRAELDERFGEIEAFADIGDFIDQPVKSYSSGMYVRLAFSVAIHVMPDILIIDEALSVGDEAFQRKCFGRIEAIRSRGATVLFVSHSAGSVIELCDRAVLLDHGEMLVQGSPKYVVSCYHKLIYAPEDKREAVRQSIQGVRAPEAQPARAATSVERFVDGDDDDESSYEAGLRSQSTVRYVSRGAEVQDPHIETLQGRRVNVLCREKEYIYTYRVNMQCAAAALRFGMMIKTVGGFELGGAVSAPLGESDLLAEPGQSFVVRFRFVVRLAPGTYFMNAGVTAFEHEGEAFLERVVDAMMFRVRPDPHRIGTGAADFVAGVEVDVADGVNA